MNESENTELINKMSKNDINAILCGICSNLPILQMNTILFGTKYKIINDKYIKELKNKGF